MKWFTKSILASTAASMLWLAMSRADQPRPQCSPACNTGCPQQCAPPCAPQCIPQCAPQYAQACPQTCPQQGAQTCPAQNCQPCNSRNTAARRGAAGGKIAQQCSSTTESKSTFDSYFATRLVNATPPQQSAAPQSGTPQDANSACAACRWQEDPADASEPPSTTNDESVPPLGDDAAAPFAADPLPPANNDAASGAAEPAVVESVPPAPLVPSDATAPTPPADPTAVKPACNQNCCAAPCLDTCSWIAGGEGTFLFPHFRRDDSTLGVNTGTPFNTTSGASTINNSMFAAPRVWLGVQGCKWGFVGRYWGAQSAGSFFDPTAFGLTRPATVSYDRFSAYLADLEVQRLFFTRTWSHRLGFGVRYGSVNLDTNNVVTSGTISSLASAAALRSSQFNGTGLTLGLYSLRPLGDSCWSLYAAPRLSVLWGGSRAAAQTSATAADVSGTAVSLNGAYSRAGNDLFIAELGWGVQWERQLVWSPARAFFRFGGEYQYWNTGIGHNRAVSSSFAAAPTAAASASASANNGLLFNLIGFTFAAGIVY